MRIQPSFVAIQPLNHGQSNKAAKPDNALAQGESKAAPPGLERALARLQSLSTPTTGQANAIDRIGRNLARYAQTQAIGTPPVPAETGALTPTPEPEASTPAAAAPDTGTETTA